MLEIKKETDLFEILGELNETICNAAALACVAVGCELSTFTEEIYLGYWANMLNVLHQAQTLSENALIQARGRCE